MLEKKVAYREVVCTDVDWENRIFDFEFRGYMLKYHHRNEYPKEDMTDAERICHVIDEFLAKVYIGVYYKNLKTLEFIDKSICEIDGEENDYDDGKHEAFWQVKQYILNNLF